MLHWFYIFRYPVLNGICLPFKIYHPAGIKIMREACVKLQGRLTLGNPDKQKAVVSRLPINLFFGNKASVTFGKSISVGPGVNIIVKDTAVLMIGDGTYFTSDSHIEAVNSIEIGSNCAISWGVTIIDDNHHQLIPKSTNKSPAKQVRIGNHVWIGCNVTILEGTQIGHNSIIAAGSVVKGVFPDHVLIAGNPARVVKQAVNWE
jgi:acetyltransferase-like isoleucine patch superfamily enzyme